MPAAATPLIDAPALDAYAAQFARLGLPEDGYLRLHYPRFVRTRERLHAHWDTRDGRRLLDVGAHWLHQTLLYALDGFEVTALDLPATLEQDGVRELARAHAIRLLPNADLADPQALREIADDSFDLVLFTEVIEHLAFNPVALWREIYRVMRPGARIVVTTPNYYALRSSVRRWLRALSGRGGGVRVQDILNLKTMGHHWKEYSLRELEDYFALLSPDFRCINAAHVCVAPPAAARLRGRIAGWLERAVPALRPDLYLEVELGAKRHGIVVEPHW